MFGKWMATAAVAVTMAATACSSAPADEDGASTDNLVALSTECRPLSDVPGMKIERPTIDNGALHLRIGVTGGEAEDVYVKTSGVKDWVSARQRRRRSCLGVRMCWRAPRARQRGGADP